MSEPKIGVHWSQVLLGVLLTSVLAGLVVHAVDTQQDGEDVDDALIELEADSSSLIEAQARALDLVGAVDSWEEGGSFRSVREELVGLDELMVSTNGAGSPVAQLVGSAFRDRLDALRPRITDPQSNPALASGPAEAFRQASIELSRKYKELLDPGSRVNLLSATEHDERGVALVLLVVALGLALGVITVFRSRSVYRSSRARFERDREELARASVLEFGEAEILAGIVDGDDVGGLIARVLDLADRLTGRRFRFVRTAEETGLTLPAVVPVPASTGVPDDPLRGDHRPVTSNWPVRAGLGSQVGVLGLLEDRCGPEIDERTEAVARRCADLIALVIDRALAEQQLVHRANHDGLTGMPNRSRLLEVVASELDARRRSPEHEVALIFCDLDRFKLVNDSLGHRTGDELLRAVGRRLSASLEGSGTVLFRLGGDEFVAVCTGPGAGTRAAAHAEELSNTLVNRFVVAGSDLFVGASFGIALADSEVTSPEALLRNADIAMYASKRDPLSVVTVYDAELEAGLSAQFEIDAALRSTLDGEGMTVHFQPLFDVQSSTAIGVEALVRWNRDGRLVYPDEFLPVARAHGLMGELGRSVMHEALRAMSAVRSELPGFSLWLNVDLLQLRDASFPDLLAAELREARVLPSDLVLELSEADLLEFREIAEVIDRLRAMGARFAVDDFGTGYSSIVRLTELPIDIVKLDRALVAGITGGGAAGVGILEAAVALVSHAGLDIVVEGVETESELEVVRRLGCTIVQGYHLRRPGPADEVLAEQVAERRPARLA